MSDSKLKSGDEALYLFCLARSNLLPDVVVGAGLDNQTPIFLMRFQNIAAVLSKVSFEDFCGSSAESRMKDLAWLGPRVCHHEMVIERMMHHTPVYPARFGTLFSSIESIEKLLKKHHDEVLRFLDKVLGKDEWAVKGLINQTKAKDRLLPEVLAKQETELSSSPGIRYFQEQRIKAGLDKVLKSWLKEVCPRIVEDLKQYSSDFCERKVLTHGGEAENDMILNWAFLVPKSAIADFRKRIEQINTDHVQKGLVFELSGPWPPYSFSYSLSEKG
jgi:hypothetical protein